MHGSVFLMKKSNIKIYISCHKDCYVPRHPFLFPIQVGAALSEKKLPNMLYDNTGDNISAKNRMYCELTAQYWVWKNDTDADYYGFWHYRRYMNFSDAELPHNPFEDVELEWLDDDSLKFLNLDENVMRQKITQYDVIATTPVVLKKLNKNLKSNRHQYELTPYQYKEDLDVMLDIIKEKYPEYYDIANYYLDKSPLGYYCNMFVMKRELFQKYSEWLFTILFEHEKRRDYTDYDVTGYRVSGYLGERLFAIWYLHLQKTGKYKTCDLQRTLFKNVEKQEETKPAFAKNNVAVALAANDYFAPYLGVTLASVAKNSSTQNNYDILVLTTDISEANKAKLQKIIAGRGNFSLRFINPKKKIDGFLPYLHGHFGHIETYYRLVLPEFLKEYDKVLYLDSDMVVCADVAQLFAKNVDGYLLAVCHDADTAGLYNGWQKERKKYSDEVLKLKEPYQYFQAGTILFNLAGFRKSFKTADLLDFASKEKWLLQDQDVLNKLCEGRVKYMDMAWNVMVDYNGVRVKEIIALAPQWLNRMYMDSRKNPKIIHYAGPQKPWLYPDMDFGADFWEVARETPFYESLLFRTMHRSAVDEFLFGDAINRKTETSAAKRAFKYLNHNGVKKTVKKIIKTLIGKKDIRGGVKFRLPLSEQEGA